MSGRAVCTTRLFKTFRDSLKKFTSQYAILMECDDQVVAAPRSAGVAKVVLCSHKTLLHAVKHDGSVE